MKLRSSFWLVHQASARRRKPVKAIYLHDSDSALHGENFTLLRPRLTSMPISLGLSTSVASRRRHGYPQVSHMCFPPYLPDLCASLPEQLWVNRPLPTFPRYTPHIRFLFVRLEFCYRLPSSRSLPPSTCTTHSSFPGSGGQRTFTA